MSAIFELLSAGVLETRVGATLSYVTELSVLEAVRAALPQVSLTLKLPDTVIVTTPAVVGVTFIVQRALSQAIEATVPFVTVKSAAVTVEESRVSLALK